MIENPSNIVENQKSDKWAELEIAMIGFLVFGTSMISEANRAKIGKLLGEVNPECLPETERALFERYKVYFNSSI